VEGQTASWPSWPEPAGTRPPLPATPASQSPLSEGAKASKIPDQDKTFPQLPNRAAEDNRLGPVCQWRKTAASWGREAGRQSAQKRQIIIDLDIPQSSMYKSAMKIKRTNPDFLNGVPELLILSLLLRRSMYGYELVQAIRQSTQGTLEFGEGCIYPILHRLEAEGLLVSRREKVGGRSRVVYRLTAKGARQLSDTRTAWQRVVQAIHHALQGGEDGEPALVG
jgi:PadR family transcriptional regulator, regulatory protein PadR